MKLALQLNDQNSKLFENYEEFGWLKVGDTIHPIWDENFEEEQKKLNSRRQLPISKCTCKTGCSINGPGCKNCSKSCKPCSIKCFCKGMCNNPHNNGGDCNKCHFAEEEVEIEELEVDSSPFCDLDSYFNVQSHNYVNIPNEMQTNETEVYPENFPGNDLDLHLTMSIETELSDTDNSTFEDSDIE